MATKPNAKGRKPLEFLLLDCPSEHEIDGKLTTECEALAALLHNKGVGTQVKHARLSSPDSFKNFPYYTYSPSFVHVACHGSAYGPELLGGDLSWRTLATHLKEILGPLPATKQRILNLSCCHSTAGMKILKKHLEEYVSGIYYFTTTKVGFADAFSVWAMFYLNKDISKPHNKIKTRINTFFAYDLLQFTEVPRSNDESND